MAHDSLTVRGLLMGPAMSILLIGVHFAHVWGTRSEAIGPVAYDSVPT